jgi:hypothetical protein
MLARAFACDAGLRYHFPMTPVTRSRDRSFLFRETAREQRDPQELWV